jgi:hypothetical protein
MFFAPMSRNPPEQDVEMNQQPVVHEMRQTVLQDQEHSTQDINQQSNAMETEVTSPDTSPDTREHEEVNTQTQEELARWRTSALVGAESTTGSTESTQPSKCMFGLIFYSFSRTSQTY